MAEIRTVTAAEALGLGWLGTKAIMAAMGCPKQTFSRYTDHPDFPAPSGQIKPESGRPENAWLVSALPESILVKGKAVAVRGPAEAALHAALHVSPSAPRPETALVPGSVPDLPAVADVRGQVRAGKADAALTDKERAQRDAGVILCRAIEDAVAATKCSVKRACAGLAARLVAGEAHADLVAAAYLTYSKPRKGAPTLGGEQALAGRLQRMFGFFEAGRKVGDVGRFLVPGKREKTGHNPVHVAAFLRFFCDPHQPPVTDVYKKMVPYLAENGLPEVSYSTVTRIENELPVTVKYRGRVTGSAWRSLKPYVERDVSMFFANDIWVGDGHSFKAKVQHPIHGQPFTPEITMVIDWVSRKIVGWSVALSESTLAVSDAFRHAQMQTRARPLVYYSDNGSGQTGKRIDCPIAGTLARQGIRHETGIPGNPQARGILERLWQVVTIPLARTYPTCTWRGADENATTKMLKLLNRKDQGGVRIPSFRELIDDLARVVDDYNLNHAHRELGGKAPEDVYQERIDRDSIVFGPNDRELNELWMPEVLRSPSRGVVQLFGNEYFRRDLVDVLAEREKVRVRYDLHDAKRVWLFRLDGTALGEAEWHGHRVEAFPVSGMDMDRKSRADGKIRRGQKIIAEAQAELGDVYDVLPEPQAAEIDLMPRLSDEALAAAEAKPQRKKDMDVLEMAAWLYADEIAEMDKDNRNKGDALMG